MKNSPSIFDYRGIKNIDPPINVLQNIKQSGNIQPYVRMSLVGYSFDLSENFYR